MASIFPTNVVNTGPLVQLGFAVDDVDAAAERWATLMGAGPFFVARHCPMDDITYRGEPSTFDLSSAVGWWGDCEIELMQQHCDSPSCIRDMYAPGESGLVNIAWYATDVHAEIARLNNLGFETVHLINEAGVPMAFIDTRPVLGVMTELYQDEPNRRRRKQAVRQASVGWNGENPIRPAAELPPLDQRDTPN